jgi:hypothetical protein
MRGDSNLYFERLNKEANEENEENEIELVKELALFGG